MLLSLALAATISPPPEPTPAPLVCAEGTAPGWLDEAGLPTSCVGDLPCPPIPFGEPCPADLPVVGGPVVEVLVPAAPTTAPETAPAAEPVTEVAPALIVDEAPVQAPAVERLAETGSASFPFLLFAVFLIGLGASIVTLAILTGSAASAGRAHAKNLLRSHAAGHDANDPNCSEWRGDFVGVDLLARCAICPSERVSHRRRTEWFS